MLYNHQLPNNHCHLINDINEVDKLRNRNKNAREPRGGAVIEDSKKLPNDLSIN